MALCSNPSAHEECPTRAWAMGDMCQHRGPVLWGDLSKGTCVRFLSGRWVQGLWWWLYPGLQISGMERPGSSYKLWPKHYMLLQCHNLFLSAYNFMLLCWTQMDLFVIRSIPTSGCTQSLTYHFHIPFASLALWMVKSDKFKFVSIYIYNSYSSWVSGSLGVPLLIILFQTKRQ